MAKLTHDGEASPAGNRLDAQVSERFSDDCLHLAPKEPHFLWLLCTGFGQQRINRLLQLYKAQKVAVRKLLVVFLSGLLGLTALASWPYLCAVDLAVCEELSILKVALRIANEQLPDLLAALIKQWT